MPNRENIKKFTSAVLSFVIAITLIFMASPAVSAIVIAAGSAPGSGSGYDILDGIALNDTTANGNCVGYRVSVIQTDGSVKGNKKYDLMKDTTSYNIERYGYPYHAEGQKNKLEYIKNIDAAFSTTTSASGYNTATFSAWGLTWKDPSEIMAYLEGETPVNTILKKLGFGSMAGLNPGDRLVIEPLWAIRLGTGLTWHFLTTTEIGIFGRYQYGNDTAGSAQWDNVVDWTNRIFPNALYTPDGSGLWESASVISSESHETFINLIQKGYGVAIAYSNDFDYKIAFNANGGSGSMSTLTIKFSEKIALSANTFARPGYTFTGWNTKADGSGTAYANNATVSGLSQTKNATVTLYAQWILNGVKISYRANGGTVSAIDITVDGDVIKKSGTEYTHFVDYGEKKDPTNASAFGLTKVGYSFTGWAITGNESIILNENTEYDATQYTHFEDKTKNVSNTQEVTCVLVAQWELAQHSIEYKANGGSGTMADQTVKYGEAVEIRENSFNRDDYTFMGWTTNSDGSDDGYNWTDWSGKWYFKNGEKGIADNKLVLYARWQKDITIVYDANGGTGSMPSQTAKYGETVSIAKNAFQNGSAKFLGWTTMPDGNNDGYNWIDWSGKWYFKNGERGIAYDHLILFARWSSDQFLDVVPILPNTNYREGVEVISSFRVYNLSNEVNVDALNPGSAYFTITADGMDTVTEITPFYVPNGEVTTIYYRWRVPAEIEDYSTVTVRVDLKVGDKVVGEATMKVESELILPSNPPHTQFEDKAPSDFTQDVPMYSYHYFYDWYTVDPSY